jgi:hypothetical protein
MTVCLATTGKSKLGGFVLSKIKAFAFTASLCASLLLPAQAQAARLLVVYTGTVSNDSIDETGVFGGGVIDGARFRAEFVVDDSAFGAIAIFGPDFSQLYGGLNQGPGFQVPATATLTINGVSRAFGVAIGTDGGTYYSDNPHVAIPDDSAAVDSIWHSTGDKGVRSGKFLRSGLSLGFDAVNLLANGDYRTPLTYTLGEFGEGFGSFNFSEEVLDANNQPTDVYDVNAYGVLSPNFVEVTALPSLNAVPEPASWAMMITGFGLVGGAMRRRARARERVLA